MNIAVKYSICIAIGVLTQIVIVFAAIGATFAGCGSAPLPREFAFITPYYLLLSKNTTPALIVTTVSIITFLQMPLYGWILADGWAHRRFWIQASILAGIHLVVAVIAYLIYTRA